MCGLFNLFAPYVCASLSYQSHIKLAIRINSSLSLQKRECVILNFINWFSVVTTHYCTEFKQRMRFFWLVAGSILSLLRKWFLLDWPFEIVSNNSYRFSHKLYVVFMEMMIGLVVDCFVMISMNKCFQLLLWVMHWYLRV